MNRAKLDLSILTFRQASLCQLRGGSQFSVCSEIWVIATSEYFISSCLGQLGHSAEAKVTVTVRFALTDFIRELGKMCLLLFWTGVM